MKSVPICENHLSEFYEAVKEGNMPLIEKLEHELTEEEKCVACAYVFKTNGTVKEALEDFFRTDGLSADAGPRYSSGGEAFIWGLRFFVFSGIFGIVYYLSAVLKQLLMGAKALSLFSFNFTEYILIVMVSVFVFVVINETFLN